MKQLPPIPSSLEGLTKNALEIYKIEKMLEFKMEECEQSKKVLFFYFIEFFSLIISCRQFLNKQKKLNN